MNRVIRIYLDALGRPTEHDDRYVVEADPDGDDGVGTLITSPDSSEARVFSSVLEARGYWMQTSTVRPTRWDGKPNRPMTAYNIVVEPAPEEQE